MFFVYPYLRPVCAVGTVASIERDEKKRQGHDKYSGLYGLELAQVLGMGTMHGGMAVSKGLLTETEAAWV